jgi:flagellar biosynthesis regulator FlbT
MALKIKMDPFERIFIGTTAVINCWSEPAKFTIEGTSPILRQASTMLEERADTPLRQVYLCVQKLYLGDDSVTLDHYFPRVAALLADMPRAAATVAAANAEIAAGSLYGALTHYRKLLDTVGARDWAADVKGVFAPTATVAARQGDALLVIRAPRRGRPERQPERERATAA